MFSRSYKFSLCKNAQRGFSCSSRAKCEWAHTYISYLAANLRKNPLFKTEYCKRKNCPVPSRCTFIHNGDLMQKSKNWSHFGWEIYDPDPDQKKEKNSRIASLKIKKVILLKIGKSDSSSPQNDSKRLIQFRYRFNAAFLF